jgi:molecular chaperone GrpE
MAEQNTEGAAPAQSGAEAARHEDQQQDPEVTALREQVADLENRWLTAVADLDNVRKRAAREAEHTRDRERTAVAREWLPVLDNLDIALQHAASDPGAIVEGVRAVRDQAAGVLARLGFPRRDGLPGSAFDPARHEAVSTVATGDVAPGTIVQTVRTGYGDGDHQLRPPGVVVAVAAPEPR